MKHLIDKGADVNVILVKEVASTYLEMNCPGSSETSHFDVHNYKKLTPLTVAAWKGHCKCVLSLLEAGVEFISTLTSPKIKPEQKPHLYKPYQGVVVWSM